MIGPYARPSDWRGLAQIVETLVPLALLWWAAAKSAAVAWWLPAAAVLPMALFTLRVFVLMHDCGHHSLFRSRWLNRAFGFLLGVAAGMPQYVWSQHHNFHHAHNGNWEKYRGPYTTYSTDEYAALTEPQRRRYRRKCHPAAAPIGGFIYLIFNPRYTWARGTLGLVAHIAKSKIATTGLSIRSHAALYRPRFWKSRKEYWHMLWNNVVLLAAWAMLCVACGPWLFFGLYLSSVSLAGGIGILLFTVQHNFEHSYATGTADWDYDRGAIEGTSFLVLPRWLNWFTADIGYHHIHHMSASIPNYRLAACHHEFAHLFPQVTRLTLRRIPGALKCILWDVGARRIITLAEYRLQT